MNRKIPPGAFEHYYGLGPGRSYQAVADEYGVTKRAVTDLARREGWSERLRAIEKEARERSDAKLVETLEEMNDRHLKLVRAIQVRAIEAIKAMPIATAMEAARALDMTIKQERLIRGEATDRQALRVEDVIRSEYDRWLGDQGEEQEDDQGVAQGQDGDEPDVGPAD